MSNAFLRVLRPRFLFVALPVVCSACVSVNRTVLMDRSEFPVPAGRVQVFLPEDEVPGDCQRVAIMDAEADQDSTSEAQMLDEFRKVAGKLGANAIQLRNIRNAGTGERIVGAVFDTPVERTGNAIALWCPSIAGDAADSR